MTQLHFAMQFREEVPVSHFALTPLNGEYLLVNAGYANDIIGAKWFVPFDDELGHTSLMGTDEEQERDCSGDDWLFSTWED
jgi:hypothetical protein